MNSGIQSIRAVETRMHHRALEPARWLSRFERAASQSWTAIDLSPSGRAVYCTCDWKTTSFSIVIVGPGIVDPICWDGAFARPQRMVHQPPYEPDCRVQLRTINFGVFVNNYPVYIHHLLYEVVTASVAYEEAETLRSLQPSFRRTLMIISPSKIPKEFGNQQGPCLGELFDPTACLTKAQFGYFINLTTCSKALSTSPCVAPLEKRNFPLNGKRNGLFFASLTADFDIPLPSSEQHIHLCNGSCLRNSVFTLRRSRNGWIWEILLVSLQTENERWVPVHNCLGVLKRIREYLASGMPNSQDCVSSCMRSSRVAFVGISFKPNWNRVRKRCIYTSLFIKM
ncbi:predicted protein [Histoplasma capsulatum G186AR]|uniref:Uncharacterized protein n=1 Tax=Ajellomyces capsulatus (strain G186AR / H82 / ATCC MYA-2454 / RMSCC 2432) TaxID=447093 RepID=C0NQI0_AJECG|nr:uncharacterized protein HCBG_05768 [Histoplasma capsulatum G186AR]EEH06452.1 predicted protein [Histoplasma capsulatum G186AR]